MSRTAESYGVTRSNEGADYPKTDPGTKERLKELLRDGNQNEAISLLHDAFDQAADKNLNLPFANDINENTKGSVWPNIAMVQEMAKQEADPAKKEKILDNFSVRVAREIERHDNFFEYLKYEKPEIAEKAQEIYDLVRGQDWSQQQNLSLGTLGNRVNGWHGIIGDMHQKYGSKGPEPGSDAPAQYAWNHMTQIDKRVDDAVDRYDGLDHSEEEARKQIQQYAAQAAALATIVMNESRNGKEK